MRTILHIYAVVNLVHSPVLVRELQVQATRDAKTGPLNAGGWRQEAERELVLAERLGATTTMIVRDLDHSAIAFDTGALSDRSVRRLTEQSRQKELMPHVAR